MKRFAANSLIGIVALTIGVTFAWFAVPNTVATGLLRLNNMSAGLSAKIVITEIGDIHYLEGGQGETIVMVHGIYARKEHMVDLARHFVDDYHVIAIDLPGFGDNEKRADADYLLAQQQANLVVVLEALELENIHIAANSMGAYVSVLLATARPDLVASLAFIGSPLGVPTAIKSDMDIALEQGQIPLLVQTEADFHARNDWLSPNIPYVPGPIYNSWMHSEIATADKNARVWDFVHNRSTVPTVLELAPSLSMQSLIIWCRPDRIFHVSGAALLAQELPNASLSTLDECGHLPMLDHPHLVAEIYAEFLRNLTLNAER
ncbi:alpha/beta fold hydrolase [Pseudosulfitobacter sp. SM2401]|uniref:alpha/beta fold hydrolase n=1 Tax=Pseudosulfitobacter sp. SM2401 TaxID=3350098 RepID=UPI0036F44B5C